MRNIGMASVVLAVGLVSSGIASAQPHRERSRPAPVHNYMSSDSVRERNLEPRGVERPQQPQSPFGFGVPTGSYYSSHPAGGGGNGSP